MKISVIGSGTWGTAIAAMLVENGHEVCLWSYREEESKALRETLRHPFLNGELPSEIAFTSDLKECLKNADIAAIVTPSHTIRGVAKAMAEVIEAKTIVVSLSKGLEAGSLLRLSEVIREEFTLVDVKNAVNRDIAVITGPSHAEEVFKKVPTVVTVACENDEAARLLQDAFMTPYFRVYTVPDVVGAELGAALKNVLAIFAGLIDGLGGGGDNTSAALITRGIAEIARLGIAMDARIETFYGLAGIGDLIVTCMSEHSRNHRMGYLIGQGMTPDEATEEIKMVVEGVRAASAAKELAEKCGVKMPIAEATYSILFEGADPRETAAELMMRDKRPEAEIVTI